jgi:hypothetical protein
MFYRNWRQVTRFGKAHQPDKYGSLCLMLFSFKPISILRFPPRVFYVFVSVHKKWPACLLSRLFCMTTASHRPWLDHLKNAWWTVKVLCSYYSHFLSPPPSLLPTNKHSPLDTLQTPAVYVLPWTWETKINNHTEQKITQLLHLGYTREEPYLYAPGSVHRESMLKCSNKMALFVQYFIPCKQLYLFRVKYSPITRSSNKL